MSGRLSYRTKLFLVVSSGLLGFSLWACYSFFMENNVRLAAENGLVENLQVGLLAASCLVFLRSAGVSQRTDKLLMLFFALLSYSFVFRELDVEKLDVPQVLVVLGSGVSRNLIIAAAFLAIVLYGACHLFYYTRMTVGFLRSRAGMFILAAGAILYAAGFLEKDYASAQRVFTEEMIELFGYLLILLSALESAFWAEDYRGDQLPPGN